MLVGSWLDAARCSKCGYRHYLATYDFAKAFCPPCPQCGNRWSWEQSICRRVAAGVWWKPWTWWSYRIEEREECHVEEQ